MNCDLTRHNFHNVYSTPDEISRFYSEALNDAKLYRRLTAYISENVFEHLKQGIPEFIQHDGYFQLIISKDIDEAAYQQILKGYELRNFKKDITQKEILDELDSIFLNKSMSLFSFLIAIGKLDVKVSFKKAGIVHHKIGIISDGIHNLVYTGSANFTNNGILINDESFHTIIDWDEPGKRDLDTISEYEKLFESYWNNEREDSITVSLPSKLITRMLSEIDYDEIKKYTSTIDYLTVGFDDESKLTISSNKVLGNIFNRRNLNPYFSFLKNIGDNNAILNVELRINEIETFLRKVESIAKNNNLYFGKTNEIEKFLNLRIKDYQHLSKIGKNIKADDYHLSEDFNLLKSKINSYVLRPLVDKQIIGASHIINMERSLNFSVPGSGKTATVLGAFEYLNKLPNNNEKHVDKIVVIGPSNCSKSWKDEYANVSFENQVHKPLDLIQNENSFIKAQIFRHDYATSRLIILNYESVIALKDELLELINEKTFIVFDEIHRIKRKDSEKYKILYQIICNTRFRVALTGTPLPNGYIDLYNIMSLLQHPHILG